MKKLLILIAFTGFTFIANAQYRSTDESYRIPQERNDTPDRNDFGRSYDRNDYGHTSRINSYQRNAREQIARGIIDGTITSREAGRLLEMAEDIEQKENRYIRRGGLSRREVAELQNDLKNLDRRILRERKNWDRQGIDENRNKTFN